MNTRGQTTQDYAVGASVFLLTMAFVFALIPTVFAPFQTPVTSGDTVASQRIADRVQGEITDEGLTLNATARDEFFDTTTATELRERYGLGRSASVNVSLVEAGTDATLGGQPSVGEPYEDQPVVIARRIAIDASGTTYEIEVRVW